MLFYHVVITVCARTFVTCTLIKINQSINQRGPRRKWLNFSGNPDLDLDPGIFWRNFAVTVLTMEKAPHRWFGSSPKMCKLAHLRLNVFTARCYA